MYKILIFIPLLFISSSAWAQTETLDKIDTSQVLDLSAVDPLPEFPGGTMAMYKWIASNMYYPVIARENDIEGKVVLDFTVEKDGSLSDIKALKELGGGCTEASIRIVKMMPKWVPGRLNGEKVRVRYSLTITFDLVSNKESRQEKRKLKKSLSDQ